MSEVPVKRTGPVKPRGLNHLVLNVRNMDESHHFWSGLLGFEQVGELHPSGGDGTSMNMRFYSGADENGEAHHHDVGLMEVKNLPQGKELDAATGLSHVAVGYPTREAWLQQVKHLSDSGVKYRRVDHGMTHSVYLQDPNGHSVEVLYDLPREVWGDDVAGALNHFEVRPSDELVDSVDYKSDFS